MWRLISAPKCHCTVALANCEFNVDHGNELAGKTGLTEAASAINDC